MPRHATHAALSGTTQGARSWGQAARRPPKARRLGRGRGRAWLRLSLTGQPAVRTMMLATEGAAALGSVRDTSVAASPPWASKLRLTALCLSRVTAWVRVRGARLGRRTAAACSGWW